MRVAAASTLVLVVVVAACGGKETQKRPFTAADATRIASVRPVTPGWAWPDDPERPEGARSSSSPEPAELASAANKWRDGDKLANLAVTVWRNASDAHEAMQATNAYSRGWGKRSGRIVKDEAIDGLGDEAWRLWVAGQGLQVTYHWRQDNLWVEAHVHCWRTCPEEWEPWDAAARAWVDAIDEVARTGS
jgi:hypothetical protein